ncbi:MAG: hypothetical protein DI623_15640 [Sphingomonas sanxanigenens]|uniref:Uncharacterized protein n=1 Tax=Sphingomonas sanxanigenens TaxID=397260 RepID=A0A2W5A136_9SPHN|nr:MAG: hypothetical protein DI623_15640 [Sphingomonas sanxanigenens]
MLKTCSFDTLLDEADRAIQREPIIHAENEALRSVVESTRANIAAAFAQHKRVSARLRPAYVTIHID